MPDNNPKGIHRSKWPYAALILGAALFSYLHLFRFPWVPVWYPGDAPIFLEHAERMLRGEVLYRDIFQFNLPGTECLYLLLFRCFGVRLWIPNAMLLLTWTASAVLVYALSRVVLSGAAALLPPVAFIVLCEQGSIDGTHHWYSTLVVLLAINFVARSEKPARIVSAGVLLGLATVFTTNRGIFAVVGVSLFLLWEHRSGRDAIRSIVALLAPFLVVVLSTLAYWGERVGAKILFDSVAVYPLRYFGATDENRFSAYFIEWQAAYPLHVHSVLPIALWLGVNVATPVLLAAFLVKLVRRPASEFQGPERKRILVLYLFMGVFAVLAVCQSPLTQRLICAAPIAYVLGAVLLVGMSRQCLIRVVLGMLCAAAIAESSIAVLHQSYRFTGPKGTIVLLRRDVDEFFVWLNRNAQPDDSFFGEPSASWILGLRNPARIEYVDASAYTRPQQVSELIAALELHKTRFLMSIPEKRGDDRSEDNLEPLRVYTHRHFHLGQSFGDFGAVLVRNAPAVPQR